MVLNTERARVRLESPRNLARRFGVERIEHRDFKRPVLPPFIRNTAALLAARGGSRQEIGAALAITPQEVSFLGNGTRKSDVDVDSEIGKTRDVALEKLMGALGFMTKEKMEKANIKDLCSIISSTARVVERTAPRDSGREATLVVFAPEFKQENTFNVVEI